MEEDTPSYYALSFYAPLSGEDAKASCRLMGGRYQ
jgi:hypothetical protein